MLRLAQEKHGRRGKTGAVSAAVYPADQADPATLVDSVLSAQVNLVLAGSHHEALRCASFEE